MPMFPSPLSELLCGAGQPSPYSSSAVGPEPVELFVEQ